MPYTLNTIPVTFTTIMDQPVDELPEDFFKLDASETQRVLPRGMGKSVGKHINEVMHLVVPDEVKRFGKDLAIVTTLSKDHPMSTLLDKHTSMLLPAHMVDKEDILWKIEGNVLVCDTGKRIRIALKKDIPVVHPALVHNVDFAAATKVYKEYLISYFHKSDLDNKHVFPDINVNDTTAYQQLMEIQMQVQKSYSNDMYRIFAGTLMSKIKNMGIGQYFHLDGLVNADHAYFTVIQNEVPVVVGRVRLVDGEVVNNDTVKQEATDNA